MDLAASMLAEPVSQQSVAGAERYLMRQEGVGGATVYGAVVIMTQIVSTLATLLQGAWHLGHTPASQSALYPLLTNDMFPLDLVQKLVSLLARTQQHSSLCSARWCSTASRRRPGPSWSGLNSNRRCCLCPS